MNPSFDDYQSMLAGLEQQDHLRSLRTMEKREGRYIWSAGRKYLNLSSNDYLGLASDPELQETFLSRYPTDLSGYALSASSSRLLTGTQAPHRELEALIAARYGRESALVFTSGYHANLGILPALLGPGDVIFSDRLNHASLIDGIRLSGAKLYRYNHLDYSHLERLLAKHRASAQKALVLTESVFSMDGDLADLPRLVELKKAFNAWLYVDEAHALGVFGQTGLGLCEQLQVTHEVDFIVGTFGKALACLGAFVTADRVITDTLVNTMRPFIFTTALPPLLIKWIHFLWQQLPQWQSKRDHLHQLAFLLRDRLAQAGLQTNGQSQIVPVMIGDNHQTVGVAGHLQEKHYLIFAIRPPTVPVGTSRLRLSLTANMQPDDLEQLPAEIIAGLRAGQTGRESGHNTSKENTDANHLVNSREA